MIDRLARLIGMIGREGTGADDDTDSSDWHGRIVRELWRSAWRAHQSEVLMVVGFIVGISVLFAALPYLESVFDSDVWQIVDDFEALRWLGGQVVALLLAAFIGQRFGGGEAAAGTEAFALSLPPTRAQRYVARYTLGGAVLLAVIMLVMAPRLWTILVYMSILLPRGQFMTGFNTLGSLSDGLLIPSIAAIAAFATAFAWSANARTRTGAERAGPLSALLIGAVVAVGMLGFAIPLWIMGPTSDASWRYRDLEMLNVVMPVVLLSTLVIVAVYFTRRGFRDFLTKDAVDRPLVAESELRGRSLPRPGRRSAILLVGIAVPVLLGRAWLNRPFHLTTTAHLGGVIAGRADIVGSQAFIDMGNTLAVIDLADPTEPTLLGRTLKPLRTESAGGLGPAGSALGIEVQGGYAYVLKADYQWSGAYLRVVDVKDGAQPRLLEVSLPLEYGRAMAQDGDALYVVADALWDDSELLVIDISNPISPTIRSRTGVRGRPTDISVSYPTALLAVVNSDGTSQLALHDLSVDARSLMSTFELPETSPAEVPTAIHRVLSNETHAFVVTSAAELLVIDIADPMQPVQIARHEWGDTTESSRKRALGAVNLNKGMVDAALDGANIHILDPAQRTLHTVDITDPDFPRSVGQQTLIAGGRFLVAREGIVATTGACSDGYRNCWNSTADTLSLYSGSGDGGPLPVGTFHSFAPEDVAVVADRAFVAAGDRRVQVLDVVDLAQPRILGTIGPRGARRILVPGDRWAFVATSATSTSPITQVWRVDLERPDDPGTPILNALDLAARSIDILSASNDFLLIGISRSPTEPPSTPGFSMGKAVVVYSVGETGDIEEMARLDGLHHSLGAVLHKDLALVLTDRNYPPPPDYDPSNDSSYSWKCPGNALLIYDLNAETAGVVRRAIEVPCRTERLHLDGESQLLYFYKRFDEAVQVMDVSELDDSVPVGTYIRTDDSDRLQSDLSRLEAKNGMGFTIGWRSRPGLVDFRDPNKPRAVALNLDAWGSEIRAVSGIHGYAFSRGSGLYALMAERGWAR